MPNGDDKKETPDDKYERQIQDYFTAVAAERNRFITSKTDQQKTYDQTILTFSSGAIALSLTFVEKFAPVPTCPCLLYLAWGGFGLAILSVVSSFIVSQRAFQNEIDWIDETWAAVRDDKEPPTERANRYSTLTEALNVLSGLAFVVAFLFLTLFGVKNWPTKKDETLKGKPIKIEITGEVVPGRTTFGQAPTPATLPPRPVPPGQQATSGATSGQATMGTAKK
jgi:hypothetical protein